MMEQLSGAWFALRDAIPTFDVRASVGFFISGSVFVICAEVFRQHHANPSPDQFDAVKQIDPTAPLTTRDGARRYSVPAFALTSFVVPGAFGLITAHSLMFYRFHHMTGSVRKMFTLTILILVTWVCMGKYVGYAIRCLCLLSYARLGRHSLLGTSGDHYSALVWLIGAQWLFVALVVGSR